MNNDFSPLDTLQDALRRWWLVALLALVGAAIGWLAFRLGQPQYESRAALSFSIDFGRAGMLTDDEIDRTYEAMGDLISSASVIERVVAAAGAENIEIDRAALLRMTTRERTASAWFIRVRQPDPAAAARLANLWAEQALVRLTEAYGHALAADSLARYQSALETCLASSSTGAPVQPLCTLSSLEDVLVQITSTGTELRRERLAAQGLLPGLSFSWTETALPADSPVRYGQGSLILAGLMIGLLVAVFILRLQLLDRLFKPRHA